MIERDELEVVQVSESTSPEIDAKVNAFVLAGFRSNGDWRDTPSQKHLRLCDSARVVEHWMSNGTYGCDTGCDYATLEAEITCDHGEQASHEYGTFGEVSDILEEIAAT